MGFKQKMQAAEAAAKIAAGDDAAGDQVPHGWESPLATQLYMLWSAGELSATGLQLIAHAAILDGNCSAEVGKLASIGCWGQFPGTCKRDLVGFLDADWVPEPCLVTVPCLDTRPHPAAVIETQMSVFLPHEWLAAIFERPEADVLLGCDLAQGFWESVNSSDPRLLA